MKLTIKDKDGNEDSVMEIIGPAHESGSKRAHYKLRLEEGSEFEVKKRKRYRLEKSDPEKDFESAEEIKILDTWEEKGHVWAKYEVRKLD